MPNRPMYEGQLFGNYRLVRLLGRGGFAEVYLGRHIHIRRMAAIKLLLAQVDAPDIKHFKREAQIVADLHHPHIISLLDFGVHSTAHGFINGTRTPSNDHIPYIVMEYAASGTLRQRHPRGSVLAPTQALAYMAQVAEALDFAHARSIIHRDVKPENMLLNAQDSLLLSDFGIATLTSELGAQITPSVAGTAVYMAPEQLRGKTRPESDQYALAVVTYEWLCGKPPFHGTYPEIAVQHINSAPPSLRTRNPRISPAIEEVVNIALAKDPAQRYTTVSEFVADFRLALRPARSSHTRTSYNNPAPVAPHSPLVSVPTQLAERVQSERGPNNKLAPTERRSVRSTYQGTILQPVPAGLSRRTILLTLGGVALLGGVGGGVAWFTRSHTNEPLYGGSALSTTTAGTGRKTVGATKTTAVGKNVAQGGSGTSSATPVPILTTLLVYTGHSDIVRTVAWSPDGNSIVSGSRDGTAQLWNAITNQIIFNYKQHKDIVSSVTWSSDAKYIASGSFDQSINVWGTSGNTISSFNPQNKIVSAVSWSPMALRLVSACLDSDEVDLANPQSGIANIFHHIHSNYTYAVVWSPDGTKVATASGEGTGAAVQVWDVTNSSLVASFIGHVGAVFSVAWSSDGNFIASAGNDKTVRIWNVNQQNAVLTYQDHTDVVNTVAWCSTNPGILASGSNDRTVRIWTNAGITLHTYDKHQDSVTSITWSPDGTRIASASADRTVRVWQAS